MRLQKANKLAAGQQTGEIEEQLLRRTIEVDGFVRAKELPGNDIYIVPLPMQRQSQGDEMAGGLGLEPRF
jgi:hypothetical protein